MSRRGLILSGLSLLIAACSDQGSQQVTAVSPVAKTADIMRLAFDPARYTNGLKLFQGACATCHGKQGEGALNWQQKDTRGKFKPPPLNGTGHTWHHPMQVLMDVIRNGTIRLGGNMPPWKDRLSDEQIQDILYWVQSQWPEEIYKAWYMNNQEVMRSRTGGK